MNCSVTINLPSGNTLIVPREALVMRSDRPVVFTLVNDKAKWNYVTVGRTNGKDVEITGGLKAGEQVITSNNLQLAHDAPVSQSKAPEAQSNTPN